MDLLIFFPKPLGIHKIELRYNAIIPPPLPSQSGSQTESSLLVPVPVFLLAYRMKNNIPFSVTIFLPSWDGRGDFFSFPLRIHQGGFYLGASNKTLCCLYVGSLHIMCSIFWRKVKVLPHPAEVN
jgi:hypothetical protein